MKELKITMIAVVGLLLCTTLSAQTEHEFSIYGGAGISTLNYSVTVGEQKMGFGGQLGLGYTYFFSPNLGLRSGLELALYNSKFNLKELSTTNEAVDLYGDMFIYRSKISDLEEKQRGILFQIPVMLQFQGNGNHKFYGAVGAKLGLPIGKSYSNTGGAIYNTGFYGHENYEYDEQEFVGFGHFKGRGSDGSLDLKMAFLLSAEAGMKWQLSGMSLYTGIYFDYGLNNIADDKTAPLIEYNRPNPRNFTMNSIIHAQYSDASATKGHSFTDKVKPMAIGIKLRLAFGGAKKTVTPAPAPRPIVDDSERLAREAAAKAEAERLAKEAAERAAAEKAAAEKAAAEKAEAERLAREKAAALQAIKGNIAEPVDGYTVSQTALTNKQKQELDKRIALLQENPDMNVFIYGHTCEIGSDKVNERVGLARAEQAKAYMISKGIDAKRITGTASKLEKEPLVSNTNESNRKLNRRVVIMVVN